MKTVIAAFSIIFLAMLVVFLTGPAKRSLPANPPSASLVMEDEGPGHPGWYAQWYRMRQNEQGIVPEDYLSRIYLLETARQKSHKTTATLLSNVSELGPDNVGGRTRAIVQDISNHDHLIVAGISGGIWQSSDRGLTWTPNNDQAQCMAVTSIAQDPNQPADIYFSTGEIRGNSAGIGGLGVFKSTDGGSTFNQLPSTATNSAFQRTWRVEVSPVTPGRVYVATRNNGLQLSTDGGASWNMAFGITNGMEVSDVEVFADGSVLIGVRTQGIFYSPTGNVGSFVQVSSGLPSSGFRRVELAYCDSFPNIVYSIFEDVSGSVVLGVYKSTDQGQSWAATDNPETTISFSFPWYCLTLAVQPDNPNFVIAAGQQIAYSTNGGTSWSPAGNSHADYHVAAFDLDNPQWVFIGNDGGIWKYSVPFMNSFPQDLNAGYSTTQFYAGAYFPQDDVLGGTQDNGTHVSRAGNTAFDKLFGGDGAYCAVNQQNPTECYVSFQNGQIRKSSNAQSPNPNFSNVLNQLDGDNDGSIDDGAWFINPFDINLEDGNQVYFVTLKRVWRTIDGAANWEPVTNDLRVSGNRPYCVGISQEANPTVYAGGESALLYRMDAANTASPGSETDLAPSVPAAISSHFLACILVHPQDPSVIYTAFTTVSSQPRVWRVNDANTTNPTWTNISGDLPATLPVNWIAVDPSNPDSVLLAGTDLGLYSSTNAGQNWVQETDVPNAPVFQVKVRDGDRKVLIYTHGRGIWTADLPAVPVGLVGQDLSSYHIYPNPVGEELKVDFPAGISEPRAYRIQDMAGKTISAGHLISGRLQVGELTSGLYFLQLDEGDRTVSLRFIKQ